MSEPMCRTCYLARLTSDQQQRASQEPVTGTIYLCAEHQAATDALTASIDWSAFRATRPLDSYTVLPFTRAASEPRSTPGSSTGTPEPSRAASEAYSDEVPFLGDDVRAPAMELVRSGEVARLREALEQVRALREDARLIETRGGLTSEARHFAGIWGRRIQDVLVSVDAPAPDEVCGLDRLRYILDAEAQKYAGENERAARWALKWAALLCANPDLLDCTFDRALREKGESR